MSRVFVDRDLLTWEAYTSGGKFGLPQDANVLFHCRSDPQRRARYLRMGLDSRGAEQTVASLSDDELRELLENAEKLD